MWWVSCVPRTLKTKPGLVWCFREKGGPIEGGGKQIGVNDGSGREEINQEEKGRAEGLDRGCFVCGSVAASEQVRGGKRTSSNLLCVWCAPSGSLSSLACSSAGARYMRVKGTARY